MRSRSICSRLGTRSELWHSWRASRPRRSDMTRYACCVLAVFASVSILACEDGPTQTYRPVSVDHGAPDVPPGAPYVAPGRQPYRMPLPPNDSHDVCTPDERALKWNWMLKQPIVLPNRGAGIDLAGADGDGITDKELDAFCPSEGSWGTADYYYFADGTVSVDVFGGRGRYMTIDR